MPPRKKVNLEENNTEDVVVKKRERKSTKHKVVAKITENGIEGSFQPEIRRPLIAHLPIHSNEVKFYDQPIQYDPTPPSNPVAYEEAMTNPFMEINQTKGGRMNYPFREENETEEETEQVVIEETINTTAKQQQVAQQQSPSVKYPQNEYGPTTLLVQFSSSKETKELPSTTTTGCFWCCETFDSRPCVIPTGIIDNVWQVYGNFCTPQCASAYILSDLIDTHVRWERLALLHRLYASYCGGRIYPAPNRECLERFGGPMKTNDFRRFCEERKIRVDIHLPPMVSILASMDTKPIDFYETSAKNTTTYISTQSHSDGNLKLKRTKPLKDKESTLDACLNIIIG